MDKKLLVDGSGVINIPTDKRGRKIRSLFSDIKQAQHITAALRYAGSLVHWQI